MDKFYLRRPDREITSKEKIHAILQRNQIFTMAMSKEDNPYLVTMDYVFDVVSNSLYFHCAAEGKKQVYLNHNPHVWGQILEDLGYEAGECDHRYRSVHFKGKVEFLEGSGNKKEILKKLIRKFEDHPQMKFNQFLTLGSIKNVCIGKIKIQSLSGKENVATKKKMTSIFQKS